MKPMTAASIHPLDLPERNRFRRCAQAVMALVGVVAFVPSMTASAQTSLADQPVFDTGNAPGNMALALSVEYPTAISVAHTNRNYSSTSEYLGYFDPNKCYDYSYSATDSTTSPESYFKPAATATAHICSGKWSGNFLNWAMMQTVDTFRWVMTGGYRVIDTATTTVLEKAWGSNQGSLVSFPDSTLSAATIAGATPFESSGATHFKTRIWSLGNKMRFALFNRASYQVDYFNTTNLSGTVVYSRNEVGTEGVVGNASPAPGVNTSNWSSRYTASVTIPTTGSYSFQTYADDGAKLYLNNQLVIDNFPASGQGQTYCPANPPASSNANCKGGGGAQITAPVTRIYTAGTVVQVVVEYRQLGGGAGLQVNWLPPGASNFVEIGSQDMSRTPTAYNPSDTTAVFAVYDVFTRAKVCDTTVSLEANCQAFKNSAAKPRGLMQQYSDTLRYSVFGYLNDSDILRGGGVLRARQKFIGPTRPVYGKDPATNAAAEWDSLTGIFTRNPDKADADATAGVADSGAMNYVNKFGELKKGSYKGNDPVSELFYAVVRYFRNIGNVPEWYDLSNLDAGQKTTAIDAFPVIQEWDDPILYTCQKNFILGIGDVNTHADKNLPGNTNTTKEPALPDSIAKDPSQYLPYDQRLSAPGTGATPLTPFTSTDRVGDIEIASGGTYYGSSKSLGQVSPINSSAGDANSALMAGLAYDIHTTGIRPFDASLGQVAQTVETFWVDVLENQAYLLNNQFRFAAKYGGFKVPKDFKPYGSTVPKLTDAMWTNGDLLGGQPRPRNYFSGGDPATMKSGLETAFAAASGSATAVYSATLATSTPQVGSTGTASFGASYVAADWSGELSGSSLVFDADGKAVLTSRWLFNAKLTAQGSADRRIVTWDGTRGVPFVASGTSKPTDTQLAALKTGLVATNDSANYLNYLRGDRSLEVSTTVSDPNRIYRTRNGLLGDIVNSKPVVVGPPSFPYAEATNLGYTAFKSTYATRRTVVYVGANDGMLHAVNGALLKTSDPATTPAVERDDNAGKEMFAYVPAALFQGPSSPATPTVDGLASIGKPTFTHHYMVDATAASYDVDFARTDQSGTSTNADGSTWRTILVGGLGKGGRSYYALDITDPKAMFDGGESAVAAKVLWEYSAPATLGYTYGEPIVAKTKKYGWVVILPSGYNNGDSDGHLTLLNPRNGAVLQTIDVGTNDEANGLAHAESFIVDLTDGTVDSLYAGDLGGHLWRVDMTSATASTFPVVKLATLTDSSDASGTAQPITVRPTLKVDPTTSAQRRFVMVGTGRLLAKSDLASTQVQSFYAIIDGSQSAFNPSSTNGVAFPITRSGLVNATSTLTSAAADLTTKAGYYIDLASDATQGTAASRVTLEAATFYNSVAFVTSQPNLDICSPSGTGKLYGLDFGKAVSFVTNSTGTASFVSLPGAATTVGIFGGQDTAVGQVSLTNSPDPFRFKTDALPKNTPRRINWREVPSVE